VAFLGVALTSATFAEGLDLHRVAPGAERLFRCDEANAGFCPEPIENIGYEGSYIGHDEVSLLFLSNVPGSGNSAVYRLILPKDPPVKPNQAGTGGVWNFQLQSTFFMGMVLCDPESSPEFTKVCVPNTDANIFDSPDPDAPDFIGHHPGGAFMELQLYPPGWATSPCFDATHWCAGLTITSNSIDQNTGAQNNADCLNKVGPGPGNIALVTRNGVPVAPGNPLGVPFGTFKNDPKNILQFNDGDELLVDMRDSPNGLKVVITDVTTRQSGSMVAGKIAGFGTVVFDPKATTCTVKPYDFHPMYQTSNEHTRTTWTAHSYNVSFSSELGHFELCNAADADGNCTSPGADDKGGLDSDDTFCVVPPSPFLPPGLVQIGGCLASDLDWDGPSYQKRWPGAVNGHDRKLNPTSLQVSSARFTVSGGKGTGVRRLFNYDRVAFETNLPSTERGSDPACNPATGVNCFNPPQGADFYPIFSTTETPQGCFWQFGGAHIPGTTNTFGGNSAAEFGPLSPLVFVRGGNVVTTMPNYKRTLKNNPCLAEDR
jgi:hypothetical protein